MTRSGTAAADRGQTQKTLQSATVASAAVPEPVVHFVAYGLRPSPEGYVLCRVDVAGAVATTEPMRQPEPSLALAHAYLEDAARGAYLATRES